MATHDANPQHDSREGVPVYEGDDQPSQPSQPRGDDALGQDTTAEHDNRESDQIYQGETPASSGSADSFDSRHNEFDESEGQRGAGVDEATGEPVHGDGLAHEQAEQPHSDGFDADQPDQVEQAGEQPNAEQPRAQD